MTNPMMVEVPAGTSAYDQNAGLDANHDGEITKGEAAAKVVAKRTKGLKAANRG